MLDIISSILGVIAIIVYPVFFKPYLMSQIADMDTLGAFERLDLAKRLVTANRISGVITVVFALIALGTALTGERENRPFRVISALTGLIAISLFVVKYVHWFQWTLV